MQEAVACALPLPKPVLVPLALTGAEGEAAAEAEAVPRCAVALGGAEGVGRCVAEEDTVAVAVVREEGGGECEAVAELSRESVGAPVGVGAPVPSALNELVPVALGRAVA